jgi:hypothetical protein
MALSGCSSLNLSDSHMCTLRVLSFVYCMSCQGMRYKVLSDVVVWQSGEGQTAPALGELSCKRLEARSARLCRMLPCQSPLVEARDKADGACYLCQDKYENQRMRLASC